MIVVLDASTFVSAALKANSLPERALLRAVSDPNRLLLLQAVEEEYREVIFRPKFDRFVSIGRRQRVLDIAVFAAERIEPREIVRECRGDPKDDKCLALAAAGQADVIVSSDVRHLHSDAPVARHRNPVTGGFPRPRRRGHRMRGLKGDCRTPNYDRNIS